MFFIILQLINLFNPLKFINYQFMNFKLLKTKLENHFLIYTAFLLYYQESLYFLWKDSLIKFIVFIILITNLCFFLLNFQSIFLFF